MQKIFYLIFFIILINSFSLYSQNDPPIEWGEIPEEDLRMKDFPEDPNATALILCDYGESNFNVDLDIEYTRHLRVKILNENGYKWGSHKISIHFKDNLEIIKNIEAVSYSLDSTGEIIETELDDDDIYQTQVNEYRMDYSFAIPNLKPGCIVEIKYKIISSDISFIRDWDFQYDEPVRWSEYRIKTPKAIDYAVVTLGFEPWEIAKKEEVFQEYREIVALLNSSQIKCDFYQCAVKNLPAIREEPFITTTDNYKNRLQVQLRGYAFVGIGVHKVIDTWENLVKRLTEADYFMGTMEDSDEIKDIAASVTAGIQTPKEKAIAIFNWVKKSITCSDGNRVTASNDLDEVLNTKKGSNSEITFLLLSLLKAAGINGDPVILSTRDNGMIQKLYPIIDQFNYTLARVNLGQENILMDATDPLRPYDLLPEKVMNVQGLVIKSGIPEWINITSKKKNMNHFLTVIDVKEDGTISGSFDNLFSDYTGLKIRDELYTKNDLKMGTEIFDVESEGILLDSVKIFNKDSVSVPLSISASFSSNDYAQKAGDNIYLTPVIAHRWKENPFKTASRKFPIDYGYARGVTNIINVTIPEGYVYTDTLSNQAFNVPNCASYIRQVQVNGNMIQIFTKYEIKEPLVDAKLYEYMKKFYEQIVASQAEQLVISKKTNTSDKNTSSSDSVKK